MECLDFLREASQGDITVYIELGDEVTVINGISAQAIESCSSRLLRRLSIRDDNPALIFRHQESKVSVISLLRFAYLGDYRLSERLIDQPCSLLFHLQMYKIGQLYYIDALQEQARLYFLYELEYACSEGQMAIDLCNAVRFLYLELDGEDGLRDSMAHYCVSNMVYHGLCQSEAFRQTIYECPAFHQLLLHTNLTEGFTADGAADLIAMRTCDFPAHRSWSSDTRRAANFLCHMHTADFEQTERESEPWDEPSRSNSFVLVERPRLDQPENSDKDVRTVRTLNAIADEHRAMASRSPSPAQPVFARRLPLRPTPTFSSGDFDAFESTLSTEYRSAVSHNHANHSIAPQALYSNHAEELRDAEEYTIQDSELDLENDQDMVDPPDDWFMLEPSDDEKPLLHAAVDPSRSGPLTIRNQSTRRESNGSEWEVFEIEPTTVAQAD
ncbi:MAG: hypothetical protein Q9159_006093 [Coniocarpon cinnabarinum]